MINYIPKELKLTFLMLLLFSCSTHIEDRASMDFQPIIPDEMNLPNSSAPSGGIYNEASGGLFATDRRAAQVGDILTVALSEDFTASKSQSATSAKSDSFKVDLPNLLDPAGDQALLDSGAEIQEKGISDFYESTYLNAFNCKQPQIINLLLDYILLVT